MREIKFEVIFDGWVLDDPLQTFKVLVILQFHVEVCDGQVEDVFVESGGEIRVEEVAIVEGFSCYSADKLEKL